MIQTRRQVRGVDAGVLEEQDDGEEVLMEVRMKGRLWLFLAVAALKPSPRGRAHSIDLIVRRFSRERKTETLWGLGD